MNHCLFPSAVLAAFAVLSAAPAQDLGFANVFVQRPITSSVSPVSGAPVEPDSLPSGTDVVAGFSCSSRLGGGSAGVNGRFEVQGQGLLAEVIAAVVVNGALVPKGFLAADAGDTALDIHLRVPRAMPVRFQLRAFGNRSSTAAIGRASIDVLARDGVELAFAAQPEVSTPAELDFVLDLPAGIAVVRVELAAALPPGTIGTDCAIASASAVVAITPAHVHVTQDLGGCGAVLDVEPLLDGHSVRCSVLPSMPTDRVWLAVGVEPIAVTLPVAPGCELTVDPLLVLPMPALGTMTASLAPLPSVELLLQGVVLRPSSFWSPSPGLLTSSRTRMTVR